MRLLLILLFSSCFASAAVIVDTASAPVYTFDGSSVTLNNISGANAANGFTVNVTFTPDGTDIAQSDNAIVLFETGGAANGMGIYLLGAEIYFRVKMGGQDPDDTSTYPDLDQTDEDDLLAVRSSNIFGAEAGGVLTAGTEYSIAAILDPTFGAGAGTISLAVQADGGALYSETWAITADSNNWKGNNTPNAFPGSPSQVGAATNTAGSPFEEAELLGLTGTKGEILFWNEVGTVVPEASTALFSLCSLLVCLRRRR